MVEGLYFLEIALDKPLYHLFTYKSPTFVTPGTRVKVPFQHHKEIGIVVRQVNAAPKENQTKKLKIRFIEKVLDDKPLFSSKWLNLMMFTAAYYLYPIGQTFFTALPKELKTKDNLSFPKPPVRYQLNKSGKQAVPPARPGPLLNLWQALQETNISEEEAVRIHPRGRYYLHKYLEAGYLDRLENEKPLLTYQKQYYLNNDQQTASNAISASLNLFKVFLLFGVTGSGKSEVYFEAIHQALKQGKQVLMLLPMINLTPQFFERLQKHFPAVPMAVLHSKIAPKKRLDNYLKTLSGEAKIIIGTRLCIFTPIENLGLIIVDEEQDESFKQESELRYNARDLAIWRGQQDSCPVVLGSATPSLESWYQMEQGKYQLLTLKERAGSGSSLPRIEFIDVSPQKLKEGLAPITLKAIQNHLIKNEVVLLLSLIHI